MQRVHFLSSNAVAVKLAIDRAPISLIWTAALWLTQTPSLQSMSMEAFYELAAIFNQPSKLLDTHVPCRVLQSTLKSTMQGMRQGMHLQDCKVTALDNLDDDDTVLRSNDPRVFREVHRGPTRLVQL